MAKKFDTNPLDPEFPEKAKAEAQNTPDVQAYAAPAAAYTAPQRNSYSTAEFPSRPPSVTEDETQRFTNAEFQAYAFQSGSPPAVYHQAPLADMNQAGERIVSKAGVAEKWLIGLPYLPFWIGMVAGLVLLLIMPKEENKVRFHAAQGLAAHVGILIVTTLLGIVGNISDSNFGSFLFWLVTTILMIVWAIKAFKGKPVHIGIIDDLTNWLEEKIGPVK